MSALQGLLARLRGLIRRAEAERELEEELRYHLDLERERNLARGLSPADAERAALRALGNLSLVKEQARDTWGWVRLEQLAQDVRFGLRQLRRSPLLTGLALVTFGLGNGAAITIATVANAVLLRPLPYHHPEALGLFQARGPDAATGGRLFSYPEVVGLEDRSRGLAETAVYAPAGTWNLLWQRPGGQFPVAGTFVSANLFDVLRPLMALGRAFAGEDPPSVAVVSHAFWQRELGGDPAVIGRSLAFPASFTVVGVLAPGVRLGDPVDVWLPLNPASVAGWGPSRRAFQVVARLAPGVSPASLEESLGAGRGAAIQVTGLQRALVGDIRPQLLLLLAAVIAVTLLACVNVSTLLLDRALSREREIAVRVALGATGRRVAMQLVAESAVLAVAGGLAGTLLAAWCVTVLLRVAPASLSRLRDVPLDASFVLVALAFTMLCAVLSGVLPARQAGRPTNPLIASAPATGRREERRVRRALAVTQVGFAFSLLVVAGLMLRSLGKVLAVNPGFRPDGVLAVQLSSDLGDTAERLRFYESLFHQVRALPGVSGVAASTRLPLREAGAASVESEDAPPAGDRPEVEIRRASRDYFRTLEIPLIAGRAFSADDRLGGPGAAVVNQSAARLLWPGRDPVGRRLRLVRAGQEAPWLTVLGVVGDVRPSDLESDPRPAVYLSFEQGPPFGALLLARTAGPPEALVAPIRKAVGTLDPTAAIVEVVPLNRLLADALAPRRYTVRLLAMFGGLAVALAFVGVYATVSHVTGNRRREIALRMSLGATGPGILRLALAEAFWYILPGLALGVAAGVGAARLLGGLLFGIGALDPLTFLLVSAGVSAVVLLAAVVPAVRAARLQPAPVLRGG